MMPRRSKYGNTKTIVGGVKYDSKLEAKRGVELALLEKAGLISDLRRQVRYPLVVNGHLICTYIADFVYVENGEEVVCDVKSAYTVKMREFINKAKLFAALHGKPIQIWPELAAKRASKPSTVSRKQPF